MLEGVVTGYEARFDFPVRADPPELSYMLATVPRTGSTFVSHLLWRTGCLGAPLENLNIAPGSPYADAHGDAAAQQRLWRRVLARRTSPNGVFGIKCFPMQLEALVRVNPPLLQSVMATLVPRGRRGHRRCGGQAGRDGGDRRSTAGGPSAPRSPSPTGAEVG